jgi:hypothetical protein
MALSFGGANPAGDPHFLTSSLHPLSSCLKRVIWRGFVPPYFLTVGVAAAELPTHEEEISRGPAAPYPRFWELF